MLHSSLYLQNPLEDFFTLTTINTNPKENDINDKWNINNDCCSEFNSFSSNELKKGNIKNTDLSSISLELEDDSENDKSIIHIQTIINSNSNNSFEQEESEAKKNDEPKKPDIHIIVKENDKNKKIFEIDKECFNKDLFINVNNNKNEIDIESKEEIKRFSKKRDRFKNTDNINKKIATAFFNNYLLNSINKKLNMRGIGNYFEKFMTNCINKNNKNIIMNMTLKQFIEKKEFYSEKNNNMFKKYKHNVKVINILEKKNYSELKMIMNTSLRRLYETYINSDNFKIDEIKRIKKKYSDKWYVNRYIYLSNHY